MASDHGAPDIWDGDCCSGIALLSRLVSGCGFTSLLCHSSGIHSSSGPGKPASVQPVHRWHMYSVY